jgi:hypothetical protein
MIYITIETLADADFGIVPSTTPYHWSVVTAGDSLSTRWQVLTTPDNIRTKQKFWDKYCLNSNALTVVENLLDVAKGSTLISDNLELCAEFLTAGALKTIWVDRRTGKLQDVTGEPQFTLACALEGLCS